jgi:predicted transcriptional regulator
MRRPRGDRKYRVVTPGRAPSQEPMPEQKPQAGQRGGRKYRITTPARTKSPETESRETPQAKKRGGRRYRVVTPGQPAPPGPEPKTPQAPQQPQRTHDIPHRARSRPGAGDTMRVAASGARKPIKEMGREPEKPKDLDKKKYRPKTRVSKVETGKVTGDSDFTKDERILLAGLDKGPGTFQMLSKRTNLTQTKIMQILKNLSSRDLVESKQIGRVKKYRLSLKGEELLHPPSFFENLFGKGGKRKTRRKKRRLSRAQRIKRMDFAIGTLVIVILVLVIYFMLFVYGVIKTYEDDSTSSADDVEPGQDLISPEIIWEEKVDTINVDNYPFVLDLRLIDVGPSGMNQNNMKFQYGYATTSGLIEPNLGNWTGIIPYTDIPHLYEVQVHLNFPRDLSDYGDSYLLVKCFVSDNAGNSAAKTFEIFIDLPIE